MRFHHCVIACVGIFVAALTFNADGGRGLAQEAPEAQEAQQGASEEAEREIPFILPDSGPFNPEEIGIENFAAITAWHRSGHANATSPSFTHWNEDGEIRPVCAVCHSGEGFRSFHGLDGSEPGVPAEPVALGGVVDCETCHSPQLANVRELTLPSGVVHPVAGAEVSCLTCHTGRSSGGTVVEAVGATPEDTVNAELKFINPHYATAAATWLGGYGAAGYHYEGRDYSGRFFHATPIGTCASCHEPHSLEVAVETCSTCHENGTPEEIRLARISYDGSGDLSVGIRSDIAANARRLMAMMGDYAAQTVGAPFVYDGNRYPYFFADANGDGQADMNAENKPTPYANWTPRLLRTAYNWKLVTADPGAYVHNPHYALELLYDSIEDLSGPLDVNMADLGLMR